MSVHTDIFLPSQGICNCLIHVYLVELCLTSRQKAVSGVLLACMGNFGTLLTYILGVFLAWRALAFSLIFLAFPYIAGVLLFVPEAPQYHLRKGETELAKATMQSLHGKAALRNVSRTNSERERLNQNKKYNS